MKSTSHAKYEINYHIVWIPKYRRNRLVDATERRLKQLLYEVCEEYPFEMVELEVMPDHVHAFVSAPPRYSPSEVVQRLKGISSYRYNERYPDEKNGRPRTTSEPPAARRRKR